MPMIDRFHADPQVFIFLISTLAGGTGLNLTGTFDRLTSGIEKCLSMLPGANKVVIFGQILFPL
jgi:hypothetical protein